MPRPRTKKKAATESRRGNPFQLRKAEKAEPQVHVIRRGVVCATDTRGHATPRGASPVRIVVDASEGFVPLWTKDTTLRWRFQERSMRAFANPGAARTAIENLLGEALLAWGDAAPVKFAKRDDVWDFEIVVRRGDDCDINGCVLASAFFPDAGRHKLTIYPKMFEQSKQEQVETLVHEIGHIFGLRHFFANLSEREWPSEVFGTHRPFSIMNYGSQSVLTPEDKADLKLLYQRVWRGELTQINGTPIRLVNAFHAAGAPAENMAAFAYTPAVSPPQPIAAYTPRI